MSQFFSHFKHIIFCSFWLLAHSAQAALNLELTQGIVNQIPIAVIPFKNESNFPFEQQLSNIIGNDLKNSGQFSVTPSAQIRERPSSLKMLNSPYWRAQGRDQVIIGSITATGPDTSRVNFSLVNVVQPTLNSSSILLSQSFDIKNTQLRYLGHHVSDLIYRQLTGIRGIFSTRLAYVLVQRNAHESSFSLNISDVDGFNSKTLLVSSQPIMSPSWSKDGKYIAYVSFEKTVPTIFMQQISTGKRELLTRFAGVNGAPDFSPNGKSLAIALTKDTPNPKIYQLNIATKELTQLTFGDGIDTEPRYSPQGNSLLFTSDRDGNPEVYQLNFATHQITRLTYTGQYNASGSFSPNGKNLVLLNRSHDGYNIAVQDISSGSLRLLTNSGYESSPSFSPNGQLILYETETGSQGKLAIASIDGNIKLSLPAGEGSAQDPSWSPFFN